MHGLLYLQYTVYSKYTVSIGVHELCIKALITQQLSIDSGSTHQMLSNGIWHVQKSSIFGIFGILGLS